MASSADPTSSPRSWSHIAASPPLDSSDNPDHTIDGNAAAASSKGKKTVWNVPSNGNTEGGVVVIDAAAYWPALSESAKASPKPSSSLQPGPSSPTSKPASSTTALVPNGRAEAPSPIPVLSPDRQRSPKGTSNKSNNHSWDNSSRSVDHHRGYGGGRRGNNAQHNNYNNRRDHERGGYEWNHRNFPMQPLHPQWGVRPYSMPPQVAPQLISPPPPPPPRPFNHNMGFHELPPAVYYLPAPPLPESLRGLPFAPHPAPVPAPPVMFYHAPDPQRAMLLKQIDYYFSPENLCKDTYLRNYMDEQGWVHISVIAGFNRVKQFTKNVQYILDTLRMSSVVEIQGDKIRRRNDWSIWVLNPGNHVGSSSSQSPTATNYDAMIAQFHNVGLENSSRHNNMRESAETSGDLNNQRSVDGQH